MKQKLLWIVLTVATAVQAATLDAPASYPAALKPVAQEAQAARLAAGILSRYHYKAIPLDDALSSKTFDQYLKALDPEKLYFLQSDIDRLSVDRTKLDEYLHSVRDVEQRTERLDAWLDVPKPKVDGAPFQRNVSKAQAGEYWRTMFDLIVLALRTDMTRVVTYMNGSEGNGLAIPEIGITQSRHNLSHHNGDPDILSRLAHSDAFIMQQFAHFLDRLKAETEDGEPLLDRTMVLFGSGMSYGHSHSNSNLPILLAGGRGLGLKHGQHIDYNRPHITGDYTLTYDEWRSLCGKPKDDKARLSNLMLTMMQKMEVNSEQFVDSLGPVSEVLA